MTNRCSGGTHVLERSGCRKVKHLFEFFDQLPGIERIKQVNIPWRPVQHEKRQVSFLHKHPCRGLIGMHPYRRGSSLFMAVLSLLLLAYEIEILDGVALNQVYSLSLSYATFLVQTRTLLQTVLHTEVTRGFDRGGMGKSAIPKRPILQDSHRRSYGATAAQSDGCKERSLFLDDLFNQGDDRVGALLLAGEG